MNRLDTCAPSRFLMVLEIELWLGSLIELRRFTLSPGLKHLPSSSRLSWSHVFQKVDHQLRHILLQRSGSFPKLSFRSFAIEHRCSRFHFCVRLEGTCLQFQALGYRDTSGDVERIGMSFFNHFGVQVLHLYSYSLTVSTTLKGPVHLGSNSDLPLVSWVPNKTKSPIPSFENQISLLLSLASFACSFLDVSRFSSGFIVFTWFFLAQSSIPWIGWSTCIPRGTVTEVAAPNEIDLEFSQSTLNER